MILRVLSMIMLLSLGLSGCAVNDKIEDPLAAIRLPDAPAGSYWYDVDTHSTYYNQYVIDISSDPVPARIEMNGKYFANTPGSFPYTGQLHDRTRVTIKAIPIDPGFKPTSRVVSGGSRLPKTMDFRLER